ncbi:BNR repeat protein [alpha proteobacterium U9-1i]|nr:BNR repeat protein [alpha proteobacterium U9-1i]
MDRRVFAAGLVGLPLAACAGAGETPPPSAPTVWRALPTEPYPGKQDDIHFVSSDIGWYGNGAGKLYRTADGGETWEKVWDQPGTFIRALGFIDAENGFLGNVGVEAYPNVTDPRPLYRTRDAGRTWSPVQAEGMEAVRGICGIDVIQRRRIVQGELRDTAIIHAAGRVGGPAAILRSVDGGESWTTLDLTAQAGMILDVKFFDAMHGLVCASTASDISEARALILRTADGGRTWLRAYESNRPFENCWKMNFPSRDVGYATVQNYQDGQTQRVLIKTTDGGASWRELPLVDDARVREFGIGFVNENWGWIGASTTGFETRDGGLSWAPIEMGRAVNKIRVLHDGDAVRAFAIGVEVRRFDAVV